MSGLDPILTSFGGLPTNPPVGSVYFNTVDQKTYVYISNEKGWGEVVPNPNAPGGILTQPIDLNDFIRHGLTEEEKGAEL